MSRWSTTIVVVLLMGWFTPAYGLSTLYFNQAGNANGLYTLDVTDGSATNVGVTNAVGGPHAGLSPSDDPALLYGSQPAGGFGLLHINTDGSGASAQTGDTTAEGIAFDPGTNTLYGAEDGFFDVINPATGDWAGLGLAQPGADVEGLAYRDGFVYGLVGVGSGGTPGTLLRYEISGDVWTNLGNTGLGSINHVGLAYDPEADLFYAKADSPILYSIDPDTLDTQAIGDTGLTGGGGLAVVTTTNVPEPTTVLMAALAVGALGCRCGRAGRAR